jgi:asparagine synthetase B (glutamine-hydrolysing)
MAGLVATFAPKSDIDHEHLSQEFNKAKGLTVTDTLNHKQFSLTKYGRKAGADENVILTGKIQIWAIGSPIYKNMIGQKALTSLAEDLEGKRLEDVVLDLDGPFFLVIKRNEGHGLWLVTDHAGILNVYKYFKGSKLAISTSAVALSRAFDVTPNEEGIIQFLRNASICDSETIYNEIEALEPASIFLFQYKPEPKLIRKEYWRSPTDVMEDMSFDKAKGFVARRLLESIEAIADTETIFDLTAGFDSRLILAALLTKNISNREVSTFVFGPERSPEVNLVKEYSKVLGLENYHLGLPDDWKKRFYAYVLRALEITDGEENACNYAPILWAQEFKAKDYMYSVNGLGGELYRDFWWMQEVLCGKRPANLERLISTRVLQYDYDYSIFSEQWKNRMQGVARILKRKYQATNSDMEASGTYNTLQIDNIYFRQKVRRWAGRTISSSNQIIKTITPLTFKKNLEAGMSIPPRYKRNGKLVKATVEMLNPVLAELRMLNGAPCQNIRLDNFYRFFPFLTNISRRGLRKVSQKMLKRTILLEKSLNYQTGDWFPRFLSHPNIKKALRCENMRTEKIFNRKKFEEFVEAASSPSFRYYQQLGNILTLELRTARDRLLKEI